MCAQFFTRGAPEYNYLLCGQHSCADSKVLNSKTHILSPGSESSS